MQHCYLQAAALCAPLHSEECSNFLLVETFHAGMGWGLLKTQDALKGVERLLAFMNRHAFPTFLQH